MFFKANDNSQHHKNIFSYDNAGKLTDMNTDGTKLKYSYPAANKTVIDFITAGSPLFKGEFTFSNGKLSEWIQYGFFNGSAAPFEKSVYTYNTAGNVTKEDLFEYNGSGWIKTEQIEFTVYDDKRNYSAQLESHIYLLNDPLLTNNPLTEVHKDAAGNIIKRVTHQYTYDSKGKKLTRKTTTDEVGVAVLVENITYTY